MSVRILYIDCEVYRRDLIRVRLDLETLSRTSSQKSDAQSDARDELSKDLAQYHDALVRTVDNSSQKIDKVDARINRLEELLMAQAAVIDKTQFRGFVPKDEDLAVTIRRRTTGGISLADAEKSASSKQAVGVRVKKTVGPVCRPGCPCICHDERKSNSPGYIDRIIGRLFVGYSGLPFLNARCDSARCLTSQTSHVSAEY